MRSIVDGRESSRWPQAKRDDIDSCIDLNREDMRFSNVMKPSNHSLKFTALENNRPSWESRSMHRSSSLNISLGDSSGNSVLPSALESVEGRFEGKTSSSSFHQGQRSLSMMPKPLMNAITINMETSNGMISQERVARPPTDGKGKNMLLSRYWPRITDQELQQLSGEYPLYFCLLVLFSLCIIPMINVYFYIIKIHSKQIFLKIILYIYNEQFKLIKGYFYY